MTLVVIWLYINKSELNLKLSFFLPCSYDTKCTAYHTILEFFTKTKRNQLNTHVNLFFKISDFFSFSGLFLVSLTLKISDKS